jgi:hypothetical protein
VIVRRPTAAAALAVALLAVLVLAGIGVAGSLRAGARSERVRGLVPFLEAQTTLVNGLQLERAQSDSLGAGRDQSPEAARDALAAVRRTVDHAAAAYRNAAVRVDVSDRDRRLHQRLDGGLAQLAELEPLRTAADRAGTTGDPAAATATVFRRYTAMIGGLLAVGGEIGLREAGQDAGPLRAVAAASSFARAKELAERELEMAAAAVALGRLDPAERTRLAAGGARQDALLDQFGALATVAQLRRYEGAITAADAERAVRLRRAAEGGSASRLALTAWSEATGVRVERLRATEPGVLGEVQRLATGADRAADRRALAYGLAFLLTACLATLCWLVARRRTAATGALGPPPVVAAADGPRWSVSVPAPPPPAAVPGHLGPPPEVAGADEPRWAVSRAEPAATARELPAPPVAEPADVSELADLALRAQELLDQQLELLEQIERDQGDPRLPGRLLQVDRLAVRARRNAYNLVVLAGGEPSRRWSEPAPLAEVVAVAVSDNRDAPRVDARVADDLLVPGEAADDLASLLGELVDNATAFSAPETRVRVSGQKVGSGYVLEVEDRGLGMTDRELEGVNRRLAGHRAAADDPEPRLGTWVAGRLAGRHDVRVQLRRSPYGGVTALVFFPEHLATARPSAPKDTRRDPAPDQDAPKPRKSGGDAPKGRKADGEALARLPLRRYVGPSAQNPTRNAGEGAGRRTGEGTARGAGESGGRGAGEGAGPGVGGEGAGRGVGEGAGRSADEGGGRGTAEGAGRAAGAGEPGRPASTGQAPGSAPRAAGAGEPGGTSPTGQAPGSASTGQAPGSAPIGQAPGSAPRRGSVVDPGEGRSRPSTAGAAGAAEDAGVPPGAAGVAEGGGKGAAESAGKGAGRGGAEGAGGGSGRGDAKDLPKRSPRSSLAPDLAAGDAGWAGWAGEPGRPTGAGWAGGRDARPGGRSPEEVRKMLTRYRSGLERGRAAAARDLPDDPDGDPPAGA